MIKRNFSQSLWCPSHVHYYKGITTIEENHRHYIDGFTYPVNGSSYDQHTHRYRGITSFENEHYHRYYGETSPAIPLPNGSHYHTIKGRVYFNYSEPLEIEYGGVVYGPEEKEVHDHNYQGQTGKETGMFPADF